VTGVKGAEASLIDTVTSLIPFSLHFHLPMRKKLFDDYRLVGHGYRCLNPDWAIFDRHG
jgi:hypothetical protein